MTPVLRPIALALAAAGTIALSLQATAHLDDKEPMQSYRQSYFTLVAMNFGPIGAMVKGEMPWDDARVKMLADELAALASMDVSRAFGPGSDKGTTRAKPGIWENQDDFATKLADMQEAIAGLQAAAAGGDRDAIAEATGSTGQACKACHDEYKSKEYLY
jgi:cytochrome c556